MAFVIEVGVDEEDQNEEATLEANTKPVAISPK